MRRSSRAERSAECRGVPDGVESLESLGMQPVLVTGVRYPPNVRGLKSSWFVMHALLPVARMTYSP